MTAIAPIPPIDPALSMTNAVMAPAAAMPEVSPGAPEKFQSLMQRTEGVEQRGPNVIGNMIEQQQGDLQHVENRVQGFLDAAPGMNGSEMVSASMEISREMAVANLKLQVATSITQGSNKSLQTLLKNQ